MHERVTTILFQAMNYQALNYSEYKSSVILFAVYNFRARGPGEGRGGRPGLPVPNSPYGFRGHDAALNRIDK